MAAPPDAGGYTETVSAYGLGKYARQDLNLQPLAPEAVFCDSQKAA
jgi:hypothetical protein